MVNSTLKEKKRAIETSTERKICILSFSKASFVLSLNNLVRFICFVFSEASTKQSKWWIKKQTKNVFRSQEIDESINGEKADVKYLRSIKRKAISNKPWHLVQTCKRHFSFFHNIMFIKFYRSIINVEQLCKFKISIVFDLNTTYLMLNQVLSIKITTLLLLDLHWKVNDFIL